jgi:hypothetical protein
LSLPPDNFLSCSAFHMKKSANSASSRQVRPYLSSEVVHFVTSDDSFS